MKYVIGIDGGGTKSIINIADLNGNLILKNFGGSTNISSSSLIDVKNVLTDLVIKSTQMKKLTLNDCVSFCIGTAGIHGLKGKDDMTRMIKSIGIDGIIYVTNDAEIVLAAESGDVEGIVLIAGTGSIAYGIDKSGKSYRCGGWGHILGDEGSGYYIGLEGLKAAIKCYDLRGPYTELLPMIKQEMNIDNIEQIMDFIYKSDLKKSEIAYFAQIVDKAFELGDKKSREILLNASKELFDLVDAIIKKMKYKGRKTTVVANGSVLTKNDFVFNNLQDMLNKKYPFVVLKRLNKDAAYGAVAIALNNYKRYTSSDK